MTEKKIRAGVPVIIALVTVVLICFGIVRRCDQNRAVFAREWQKPLGDTLAVAIEMSPLTYTLENDTAEGFDYQVIRDIAAIHGFPVVFHPFNRMEEAFRGLDDGQYDLMVASMPATERLKEFFDVTDPVYLDRQVLVQRADSAGGPGKVSNLKDLAGDTVWISGGSPFRSRLQNLARELGDTIYVESPAGYSSEQLAILTAIGEIPCAVVNEAVANKIACDYPLLDISTPVSFNQFQCWVVAKGDSLLLDSINSWLADFSRTERFDSLQVRYFSND